MALLAKDVMHAQVIPVEPELSAVELGAWQVLARSRREGEATGGAPGARRASMPVPRFGFWPEPDAPVAPGRPGR